MRNLGKPISLCQKYYEDGADEVQYVCSKSYHLLC